MRLRLTPQFRRHFLGKRDVSPCAIGQEGEDVFVDGDGECWQTLKQSVVASRASNPNPPTRKSVPPDLMTLRGPALWEQLHTWAMKLDAGKPTAWLNNFYAKIPCGDCRQHFDAVVKALPPDFSSTEAMFARTVDWHNAVNARLGKPTFTVAEARLRWVSPLPVSTPAPAPAPESNAEA